MSSRKRFDLIERIVRLLNKFSLRHKLLILYVFCVAVPIVLTDGFFVSLFIKNSRLEMEKNMEMAAYNAETDFKAIFDTSMNMSKSLYINYKVNSFLETRFENNSEFYSAAVQFLDETGINTYALGEVTKVVLCADNDTLVSSGNFCDLSRVEGTVWYTSFMASGQEPFISFYYTGVEGQIPRATDSRVVSVVRTMDYFGGLPTKKVLRIDLDYSKIASNFTSERYGMDLYICRGDQILLSTSEQPNYYLPFTYLTNEIESSVGFESTFEFSGATYKVLVIQPDTDVIGAAIRKDMPMLVGLIVINILLPLVLVNLLNRSFTDRLRRLSKVFGEGENDVGLKEVTDIQGSDEITGLMNGYNGLVRRNRQLIKTIYEDRITHQKVEIEKQQAELLSLRMQINPHFIFNVLENIRMHSVIKGEQETASMIERLAALERESVEWKDDLIPLENELNFIRNYLKLQQYRYGDRFTFSINADKEALSALIPKLTLATFVENSCVHGVEKKTGSAMIIINAEVNDGMLVLEEEDTGVGMSPAKAARIEKRMRECSFNQLQESTHIGIINSCLRLKMIAGEDNVRLTFEGEEKVGVYLRIELPVITRDGGEGKGDDL